MLFTILEKNISKYSQLKFITEHILAFSFANNSFNQYEHCNNVCHKIIIRLHEYLIIYYSRKYLYCNFHLYGEIYQGILITTACIVLILLKQKFIGIQSICY